MATKTYSQEITDAQVMLSGVTANQSVLTKRGIDSNFTSELKTILEKCIALNSEQEELKARLKTKTKELNKHIAELQKKTGEVKKIVKLDIPQTSWKEFGIADKR